jgi:hypothetical protein
MAADFSQHSWLLRSQGCFFLMVAYSCTALMSAYCFQLPIFTALFCLPAELSAL